MDPLTLGIAVFFALGWIAKEVCKSVADGYRGAAKTASAKTAAMRASNNPTDNALGWAGEQLGKVIGGTIRAVGGLAGAVGRGGKAGWQAGQAKGREIRDNARADGGQPRWRQLADWLRDRAQGRPREERRSLWERLRGWWNEGRHDKDVAKPDRPDDPPTDGPGRPPTDPDDGPGPTGPRPPIHNPWGNLAEFLPDDHPDKPAAFDPLTGEPAAPPRVPPNADPPGEPRQPAAIADPPRDASIWDCTHAAKVHDDGTGTYHCLSCRDIWACTDHDHTDQPGGDMSAPTTAPSGEVQTFTEAKAAADQFRVAATSFGERASSAQRQTEDLVAALRRVHDQLLAGGLGEATMGPAAAAVERVLALAGSVEQLSVNSASQVTAADAVIAALDTHLAIAEAAGANSDGGDRQVHGGKAES